MYTPKIKEDLIRKLYRQAKAKGIPMTKLVDHIIRDSLKREKGGNDEKLSGMDKRMRLTRC